MFWRTIFSELLKSVIMKILRKGKKCVLKPTNYRPISLLSGFCKIGNIITRRPEKVMTKTVGSQQKAYSSEKTLDPY